MLSEISNPSISDLDPIPFGMRLKLARESLGMNAKDAAAQLRLSEKVILMIENDIYPTDLPITFIRGYIRAYGKLLQISDEDIAKALEPIKPKPTQSEIEEINKQAEPVTSGSIFLQVGSFVIICAMIGVAGLWWYTHTQENAQTTLSQTASLPAESASSASETNLGPNLAGNIPAPGTEPIPTLAPVTVLINNHDGHFKYNIPALIAKPASASTLVNNVNTNRRVQETAHKTDAAYPAPLNPAQKHGEESHFTPRMKDVDGHYWLQFSSHLIIFIMIGLLATWWYSLATARSVKNGARKLHALREDLNLTLDGTGKQRKHNFDSVMLGTNPDDYAKTPIGIVTTLIVMSIIVLAGIGWYSNSTILTPAQESTPAAMVNHTVSIKTAPPLRAIVPMAPIPNNKSRVGNSAKRIVFTPVNNYTPVPAKLLSKYNTSVYSDDEDDNEADDDNTD